MIKVPPFGLLHYINQLKQQKYCKNELNVMSVYQTAKPYVLFAIDIMTLYRTFHAPFLMQTHAESYLL